MSVVIQKIIVFLTLFLVSCGSTNSNKSINDSQSETDKKKNIENIRIAVLLNQSQFNQCFKVYLSKNKINSARKGWLVIRWRIYDNLARDITIEDSYAPSLDQCFAKVVRNTSFNDVYELPTVSTVTFPFLITPNDVDLDRNIDLR